MTHPIPFYGAFESTYMPAHDKDVTETTQHSLRWRDDLSIMAASHVRRLRYPILWHRVEPEPGHFDWRHTDEVFGYMQYNGLSPVADLLHHTSYPRWVGDLGRPAFGPAFIRFVEAVAQRYPWLPAYTVCNEPFTTFLMCGDLGYWPPHDHTLRGFVRLARNVFPALTRVSRMLRDLLPHAQHVYVEAAERHTWSNGSGEAFARMTNDRRFLLTDLMIGRRIDPDRPFVRQVAAVGGDDLLTTPPGHIDVLGLDYYAHNQWHWHGPGRGTNMAPSPPPLSDLITEYGQRYGVPLMLGETNIRGYASDRATWLKYTLEQCELARQSGADVVGYCWYPFIDSADWNSLLVECVGAIDPVGVFWLDEHLDRRPSCMSLSYSLAASGTPARDLHAYRLRPPVSSWIAGWLPHMSHWQWREPPARESCSNTHLPDDHIEIELRAEDEDVA